MKSLATWGRDPSGNASRPRRPPDVSHHTAMEVDACQPLAGPQGKRNCTISSKASGGAGRRKARLLVNRLRQRKSLRGGQKNGQGQRVSGVIEADTVPRRIYNLAASKRPGNTLPFRDVMMMGGIRPTSLLSCKAKRTPSAQ